MATSLALHTHLTLWNSCVDKILAQLSSILNLTGQLEAVKRGNVGVLSQHNSHDVMILLETKLILSMEKALGHILEEKKTLVLVVKKLKKCAKDSQTAFEKIVQSKKGLEFTCHRTAEEFSPADHAHWSRQLYSAYGADLEEKSSSLQGLRYDTAILSNILSVWERSPGPVQEILQYLFYSVQRTKLKTNEQ